MGSLVVFGGSIMLRSVGNILASLQLGHTPPPLIAVVLYHTVN